MKTNEITSIILNKLSERSYKAFLTTATIEHMHEADVLGITSAGYLIEYEIKTSRSDYKADFKKVCKHRWLKNREALRIIKRRKKNRTDVYFQIPNRFFYVCEEGLIKPDEIPEYAGLIYVSKAELQYSVGKTMIQPVMTEIKPAPILHREKASVQIYTRIAKVLSNRLVYGCSYMKYHYNKLRRTK